MHNDVYTASATIMAHEYANVKPQSFQNREFSRRKDVESHSIEKRNDAKALIYSQGEELHAVRGPAARSRDSVASASAGGQTVADMTNARSAVVCHSSELHTIITRPWICIQSNGFSATKGRLQTDNRSQICLRINFFLLTHQPC